MANKNITPEERPSVLEVAEVLRTKGVTKSSLWDIHPSKWDYRDLERWEAIKNGAQYGNKEGRPPRNKKKVMRVADGIIYDTVTECQAANKISPSSMRRMLNKGLLFKRL